MFFGIHLHICRKGTPLLQECPIIKHFGTLNLVLKFHYTFSLKCWEDWLEWPFMALPGWLQLLSL